MGHSVHVKSMEQLSANVIFRMCGNSESAEVEEIERETDEEDERKYAALCFN